MYLFGAGATRAEMSRQALEADITMKGIAKSVLKLSEERAGEYWNIHKNFGLPEDQDIEIIMSLLEGFNDVESSGFEDVCNELRQLFRQYLITQVTEKRVGSGIQSSLLHLHKHYGRQMGTKGEELAGVLTTNYDSLLDGAYSTVHGAIDYGYGFQLEAYRRAETVPPLLKLHGSFNWRIEGDRLTVSKEFENREYADDCSGWIPPSVYKRPPNVVFQNVWSKAAKLTADCDVLRIVGSSLRSEDFAFLSLIFTSQLRSKNTFSIELIVPDKDAIGEENASGRQRQVLGIMQRVPFLGKLRYFSSLLVFEKESYLADNVFYSWVLMKVREIERNLGTSLNDDFINSTLLLEV